MDFCLKTASLLLAIFFTLLEKGDEKKDASKSEWDFL